MRRSLAKLGAEILIARRKRNLTTMMVADRIGPAKSTYLNVQMGDPSVSIGIYAMTHALLSALPAPCAISSILDATMSACLSIANACPKCVRRKKGSNGDMKRRTTMARAVHG